MLDDIAQLANVPRPIISIQHFYVAFGDPADLFPHLFIEFVDKLPSQLGNLLLALPQGRKVNWKDIETIVKVATETPLFDIGSQITVGSCDDPHIDLDGLRIAEPFELSLLKHAKKLDLYVQWQLTNLVQEQGGTVCQIKPSYLPAKSSGEGAFFAAEQFTFHQGCWQSGAIDDNHRSLAAVAAQVDGLGKQLLSGPGFPLNQHRASSLGNLIDLGTDLLHASADTMQSSATLV